MLTIRQEQADAFRQYHLQKFEDEMVEHLKSFSPQHWKVMGEPDGRRVIRLGIEQAGKYGFTNRGPVRFYIELMSMFGSYFDTDPQHPWASAVLSHPAKMDQDDRAYGLFAAMNQYLAQVVEPERRHLRGAVRPLMEARFEDVVRPGADIEEEILRALRSLCPARCDYVGELVLRRLIQHGFELARTYGFESNKGKVLMVVLTLAVGRGFPKDPLNGWIVRRLDKKRWPDPNRRVDELSSKALLYLRHILEREDGA